MTTATGLLLIALPIAFTVLFTLLGMRFDYPDILRRPAGEVLARFRDGGSGLVLLWWAFALTAVALAPLAVLVSQALGDADATVLALATMAGVVAAVVQFLGLMRWPFLVPYLARVDTESDAAELVFQAFNRYLGVAVGEHLGYLFTGSWTVLVGVAMTQSGETPSWLGAIGVVTGAALMVCALEFVGPFEPRGWAFAARLTPIAYVVWSLWLIAAGVTLLV